MKKMTEPYVPRAAVAGEKTGNSCPLCGEAVLRQEVVGSNGAKLGTRLVCAKRGCPWKGVDK